jgi:glycosyltransferase involved in cell wall biosynthesis
MRQRPQYLLVAFAAAGHPVYFVDPRHKGADQSDGGVTITSSLKGTPRSGVIIYTHFAPNSVLADRYDDSVIVYDILDDLSIYDPDESGLPEERRVRRHHGRLVGMADIVMVSNPVLAERHRHERADLLLIENGVDIEVFKPEGDQLDLGTAPVVGYHGAVAAWFDFDLHGAVAQSRAEYRFLLVGPVLEGAEAGVAGLLEIGNVSHVPEVPAPEVARYVRSFNVGVIPFVVDRMTEGVTPLKMFEYLASEVPVVATPLPACVVHPAVATAATAEAFARLIDEALALDSLQRKGLRSHGEAASWSRRLPPLLETLDQRGLLAVGDVRVAPQGRIDKGQREHAEDV